MIRFKKVVLIVLPLLFIQARPWQKYLTEDSIEFEIPPLEEFKLANGVTVYYRENKLLPHVTLNFIFEGGGYEEKTENSGITSLWGDSIVISGSSDYPRDELAGYLEKRGSSFSYQYSLERSNFQLSSLSGYFLQDLEVVFRVLSRPVFAKDDVTLLKNQTLEGIKKRGERPGSAAYLAAHVIEWKGKTRGITPSSQSVNSISQENLFAWQKRMFQSGRLSILVTGDFDKKALEDTLNALLKDMPDQVIALDRKTLQEGPDKALAKAYRIDKELPQTTILFRAPGIAHKHPDYYALKLFDFILGGNSFNSHLTRLIRTKNGWAYTVYSHYSTDRFTGNITLFVQTANKNVPDVLSTMFSILENPSHFLTEEALKEAKSSLRNRFVFLAETPEKLAALQLSLKWEDLPEHYLDRFLDNLDKVTLEDLHRIAKTYYRPERFFLTIVGPDFSMDSNRLGRVELFDLPN